MRHIALAGLIAAAVIGGVAIASIYPSTVQAQEEDGHLHHATLQVDIDRAYLHLGNLGSLSCLPTLQIWRLNMDTLQ